MLGVRENPLGSIKTIFIKIVIISILIQVYHTRNVPSTEPEKDTVIERKQNEENNGGRQPIGPPWKTGCSRLPTEIFHFESANCQCIEPKPSECYPILFGDECPLIKPNQFCTRAEVRSKPLVRGAPVYTAILIEKDEKDNYY